MTTAPNGSTDPMDFLTRCERCNRDRTLSRMSLIGGYHVVLCTQCENDWHILITATPEWAEKMKLGVRQKVVELRATAGVGASEDEITAITNEDYSLAARLFGIATEWMASPVPKRDS